MTSKILAYNKYFSIVVYPDTQFKYWIDNQEKFKHNLSVFWITLSW